MEVIESTGEVTKFGYSDGVVQADLRVTETGRGRLGQEIVAVDRGGDPNPSGGIVLHANNPSLARDLDGCSSRELRRQGHRELNFRIFPDLTIDVEEHATRAYVAGFGMNGSIGPGKPQPNGHFQRESGEYALFIHGQVS